MINNFTLLHLSDIHYDNDKKVVCSTLIDNILRDIKNLDNKYKLNIKFVLLTGDLVNWGGQNNLFNEAYENIISPLLKVLELTDHEFIYIPGNHELDRNAVDLDFQKSFVERINSNGVEKEDFMKENLTKRSQNYFNFIKKFYKWENNEPVKNIEKEINGYKIGFSLYNTAWCSSTYSDDDVKKLLMPISICKVKSNELKGTNLKFALMHHPIDWYEDENANDIQHVLSEYNLVLCGHKHLENDKLEQKGPLKTFYNYAHKLLPLKSKESGYTLINIFPNERKIKVYFREYNDRINGYSRGVTDCEQNKNGLDYSEYSIQSSNTELQNSYNIYSAIRKNFANSLDDLFITNSIESCKKNFGNLYVDAVLTDCPEFSKANQDIENENKIKYYKFADIIDSTHNINIFGKKQSGKTVFANALAKYYLDNFEKYKKIPIVIDCKKISISNINLIKHIKTNIFELLDDKYEISKNNIDQLVQNNDLMLILDESDFLTNKQKKELDTIELIKININDYNPLIFGEDEKSYITSEINDYKTNFYINSYRKNDIRKLINNVSAIENDNKYIENVVHYFDETSLPRTPFVISLIATICSSRKDIIPTNQAKILEQFLENVLEKINPVEQLSSTYDFNNKESFLSCLSHEMYEKKSFYMEENDFKKFVNNYHEVLGHSVEDSKFNKIFFEKNILESSNGQVAFRFECFNYYYLAKYAIKDQKFAQELRNHEVINVNSQILFYYTGLKRDDDLLLENIKQKMNVLIEKNKIQDDIFDKDPLKTNLGLTENSMSNVIESGSSMDEKKKDAITDRGDKSLGYNPYKSNDKFNEFESYENLLSVLGFTIKNSEELRFSSKTNAFNTYLDGCEILWDNFRKQSLKYAKEVNKIINKNSNPENVNEELKKAYEIFVDLIRAIVPIAVSQMMFENTATEKMKNIYENMLNQCKYNTARKMFLTFLLADLNVKNSETILNDFIKNTTSKNYLYVCLMKLIYSYFCGSFQKSEKLINPIADCAIKVSNGSKSMKGKIIESLKKNKFPQKFLKIEYTD